MTPGGYVRMPSAARRGHRSVLTRNMLPVTEPDCPQGHSPLPWPGTCPLLPTTSQGSRPGIGLKSPTWGLPVWGLQLLRPGQQRSSSPAGPLHSVHHSTRPSPSPAPRLVLGMEPRIRRRGLGLQVRTQRAAGAATVMAGLVEEHGVQAQGWRSEKAGAEGRTGPHQALRKECFRAEGAATQRPEVGICWVGLRDRITSWGVT